MLPRGGPHGKHRILLLKSVFTAPLPSKRRPIVAGIFTDPLPRNGYTRHNIKNDEPSAELSTGVTLSFCFFLIN
jgi:hypothetical protein